MLNSVSNSFIPQILTSSAATTQAPTISASKLTITDSNIRTTQQTTSTGFKASTTTGIRTTTPKYGKLLWKYIISLVYSIILFL